jgi:serine/threonine-protein kinase
MGSVWRARRLTNQAEVAIKLIDPELMASKEALSRFRREAEAAEAIRSTHVVQILDYDIDEDTPFIVMELLNGESLAQRIDRVHRLSPQATAVILGQVARALALAHGRDIVHRDMKPDNIFLVREEDDEVAKVLDFGIARHRTGLANNSGMRTRTGVIMGTPYYMSPEQVLGKEVNHLTDIWALGVIAFECITGQRVVHGDSFFEVGAAICSAPLPVPSHVAPVPDGFDEWFARTVAREQSARFQSIRAAADALRTLCCVPTSPVSMPFERADNAAATTPTAKAPAQAGSGTGLQTTAAPAARSVIGVPVPKRHTRLIVAMVVTATVLAGIALSARTLIKATSVSTSTSMPDTRASTPIVPVAKPQHDPQPSPAVITSVQPTPAPSVVEAVEPALDAVKTKPTRRDDIKKAQINHPATVTPATSATVQHKRTTQTPSGDVTDWGGRH